MAKGLYRGLSCGLIGAAALVLLLSDLHSRDRARGERDGGGAKRSVALLKHGSNALLFAINSSI